MNIITFLLAIAASFTWALCSCLSFRFGWIKFKFIQRKPSFWNPVISSQNAKTIFGYKIDGYHLLQSATFGFLIAGYYFYSPLFSRLIDFVVLSAIWIGCFPFFYGRIAPKPKP